MKKLRVLIVAILMMCIFAFAGGDIWSVYKPTAQALMPDNSRFYLGLAYGKGKLTEDLSAHEYGGTNVYDEIQKIKYNNIMLQAGYKFNQYFALESRYWKSFGDNGWSYTQSGYFEGQPFTNSGTGKNGDNMKAWGLYAKPMYPITKKTDIYALLGYGNITLNDDDYGDWLDENGFQWGIGASYAFEENFSLFLDYARLVNKDYSKHIGAQIGGSQYNWNDTLYMINTGLTYKF